MTAHIDPPRKAVNADQDAVETADWLASLGSLHHSAGAERVRYILAALDRRAKELGVLLDSPPFSPYRNSIPLEQQKPYPGDIAIETRLTAIIRWNALAMVVRANKAYGELGGHVATTPRRQRSSKSVSIISFARQAPSRRGTWCISSRIRLLESMHERISKADCRTKI
jgi:pyruvate dehydrogenase complex dehydrogenase (E1) component